MKEDKLRRVVFFFVCFLVLGLGISGWAANIYVTPGGVGSGTIGSPTNLQTALDMARVNGENDTIYLNMGYYDASVATGWAGYDYGPTSNDNMAVTLSGGWDHLYTTQVSDPTATVLTGYGDSTVLNILADAGGVSITFTLENLKIYRGYTAGIGGGIYAYTGTPADYGSINLTLKDCHIHDCAAAGGAGIWSNCSIDIYDCLFDYNNATGSGGGILINDVPNGDGSLAPKIERTELRGNSSGGTSNGGAIYSYASPVIDKCIFNINFGSGSPIFCQNGFLTVTNSSFTNNDVVYWGSAIQLWGSGGNITNCLFFDNIAGNGGSGYAALAYYDGGGGSKTVNITNCTFKGNSGDDSSSAAIHNRGAVMNIENSVFWNNMAVAGIYKQYGSGTVSYSDVQDGVYGGFTDGGNNIITYPNFVSISDPHLQKGSPCIDVGNNSAIYILSKDFDGDDRIIDGDLNSSAIVDMGFDEYNPAPVPEITANGSDGPITIPEGFSLEILISLDTVDYTGENADWWILKQTPNPPPNKWFYFDRASKTWQPGKLPTKQGKLVDITPPRKVPKTSGLTPGTYRFYFAVDLNMDGNLTLNEIFYDIVKVIITP